MALQSITNINVDFCDKKYILVNAKQLDRNSRVLSVTCYNHGELYPINSGEHSAYIRYRKSDNYGVFKFCDINSKGKIIVRLTEQMLASEGICYADLVIVNKGNAKVDTETGEIVAINNSAILSTMIICIDVTGTVIESSDIESTYDYNALNTLLKKAEAEYSEVVRLARSYAVGDADGIRENEDTDNAKYYAKLAKNRKQDAETAALNAEKSEVEAATSATKAATSEINAKIYSEGAEASASAADVAAEAAETYAKDAAQSKLESYSSATNAAVSEKNAINSAMEAATSALEASNSASKANVSETNAKQSEDNASLSASDAEDYYNQISDIVNGLNGIFLPMGTIEYADLETLVTEGIVKAGFLYNISDDFVTDDTFKDGANVSYPSGTNVYYTADGYWDCLTGVAVSGIKGNKESSYRKGNVNITVDNIGAIAIEDIATVDEVKNYLGIE